MKSRRWWWPWSRPKASTLRVIAFRNWFFLCIFHLLRSIIETWDVSCAVVRLYSRLFLLTTRIDVSNSREVFNENIFLYCAWNDIIEALDINWKAENILATIREKKQFGATHVLVLRGLMNATRESAGTQVVRFLNDSRCQLSHIETDIATINQLQCRQLLPTT